MFNGSITHTSILIAALILSGCGGSKVVETGGDSVSVGDIFTFNGQTFTVTSVASDGSSITVTAAPGGFTQATLTFTLTKSPDDKYRYSTESLTITYDPDTSVVSWSIAPGTSETDLVVEILEKSGSSLIPGITSSADFSEGTPSTANVMNLVSNKASELIAAIISWEDLGYSVSDNVDFSYSNINVNGLEDVHNSGWSGQSANVMIVDLFEGDSGNYGFDDGYAFGSLDLTHGMNTAYIVGAVAPEAEIIAYEDADYWPNIFTDYTIDVVNFSWAWQITDSPSLISGLESAYSHVVYNLDPLANANPNAVIVDAAGNNGGITSQSISYNCNTAGGRNTADSCTDIIYAVDDTLYGALDRTIFVGAYDSNTGTLENYSVSAGEYAKDYFMVADGNSIIDDTMGTSFAAPRVAGVVALTVHKFPNLTAAERTLLVLNTADDLGVAGVDSVYGHGLLNAFFALNPVGMLE